MKLYYARKAWGELFVGPLGVPTLREADRPSNWSFWSRDSCKHMGFQLSSAWDAGWQPQVPSFCPGQVCYHHPLREISGVSGPVHSETRSQGGFRTGPLPPLNWWSFAVKSPLLQPTAGSSSATIVKQTLHIGYSNARGEGLTSISTRRPMVGRSVLVHLVPRKGPGAAHHSFPPCWSLMTTQTCSSSRESSLVRSVVG